MKEDDLPIVGRRYMHTNGICYTVLCLTNMDATPENAKKYPIDVIYVGENGKVWSRRLSDWWRSFILIDQSPANNESVGIPCPDVSKSDDNIE